MWRPGLTVAIGCALGTVNPSFQRRNGLNDPPVAPGLLGVSDRQSELLWHEQFQADGVSGFVNLMLFQPRIDGFGF